MKTNTFLCFISIFTLSTQVGAITPACNEKFQTGTCVCELADGSGTVDLTPLAEETKTNPLIASSNESFFFFSFCNPIVDELLSNCFDVASSCEYHANTSTSINLGQPETTKFEMRSSPKFTTPHLALVVDNDNITRTVAFLVCPQLIPFEIIFTVEGESEEKDPDGAVLYYMTMTDHIFCPVKAGEETTVPVITIAPPVCKCECPFDGGAFAGGIFLGIGLTIIAVGGYVFYRKKKLQSQYGEM